MFARLTEGGATEEEQRIVDAIKRILGAGKAVADEQARTAEESATRAKEARDRILREAENAIQLRDISDPVEQLRISPEGPGLLTGD